MITHEQFVTHVAALAIEYTSKHGLTDEEKASLDAIKLVYGAGQSGLRGVTYYNKWASGSDKKPAPFVEVCAFGQSDWVQVAGTTIHELAHVLAGFEAGHGKGWKEATKRLGLRAAKAAGTKYSLALFTPSLRMAIASLPKPDDGEPLANLSGMFGGIEPKGCQAGIGTRGGKSRGIGSGSRLRLWECDCPKPIKARVSSDSFQATCKVCDCDFHKVG